MYFDIFSNFREILVNSAVEYLPEPHGALVVGMLLGLKDYLSREYYQLLINTGTVHLVVASGFNVAIIAKICQSFLKNAMNLSGVLVLSVMFCWIYSALIDFNPPIVRASLMFTLASVSRLVGREYKSNRILVLTTLLMLLINLNYLKSVSFWLSISASAGIILLLPQINQGVSGIEGKVLVRGIVEELPISHQRGFTRLIRDLWSDFKTTLATWIATLPITFFVFGRVSLLGLLVNPLVLWLVPLITILSFIKVFVGLISGILGYFLAIIIWFPLELFTNILMAVSYLVPNRGVSSISSKNEVDSARVIYIVTVYLIYFVAFVCLHYRRKRRLSGSKED